MWYSRRVEDNKKPQQCCSWHLSSYASFFPLPLSTLTALFSMAVTWKELHYLQHLFLRDRRHADMWLRITERVLCLRWLLAPEAWWPSPFLCATQGWALCCKGAWLAWGSKGLASRSLLKGKLAPCWQLGLGPGLHLPEINIRTVLKLRKKGRRWIKQLHSLESRGLSEMESVCEKQQNGSKRGEINAKILQINT